jgi:hypothetical protein
MMLALATAVIFWSESHGTRDHILLSQIRDFPSRRLLGNSLYGFVSDRIENIFSSSFLFLHVYSLLRKIIYRVVTIQWLS